MTSCLTISLLAFIFLSGLVICSADYPVPSASYDVGCYAQRKRILSYGFLALINGFTPTCLAGGVYRHYQCNYIGCYCVYVDTGNSYGGYVTRRPSSYLNAVCVGSTEKNADGCQTPPFKYPCNVDSPKYVYNPDTQACESVSFGCRGYDTLADCENVCAPKVYDQCSFPEDEGNNCEGKSEETRYHYNEDGECAPFTYLGCGGNSNNYRETWECEKTCDVSNQGLVTVRIRVDYRKKYNATVPQWMVNKYQFSTTEENEVVEDVYEDMQEYATSVTEISDGRRVLVIRGNKPKPPTKPRKIRDEELERLNSSPFEVCQLKPKTGLCRAYFPRWYFDEKQSKCFKFVFGGCDPNGNNFRRSKECSEYCNAKFKPTPLEEASPPRDRSGNPILPRGKNVGYEIDDGVVIYHVRGNVVTTTTEEPSPSPDSIEVSESGST